MKALKQWFEMVTMILLFTFITILWITITIADSLTRKETKLD